MKAKIEGWARPPLPLGYRWRGERVRFGLRVSRTPPPRCEMCGRPGNRGREMGICQSCGFMAGARS